MNKLHSSVALAALAAIFMAAPAVAADYEAPPPPPEYSWTGFHIGVGGGGMFGFVEEKADTFINANNATFFNAHKDSDLGDANWFGTVEAGFDWQVGSSFVVGILANYDFGKVNMKDDSNVHVDNNNINNGHLTNSTFEDKWEIGDTWAVGARAGFLAMDNALIYVMGGYTQANIKNKLQVNGTDQNFNNIEFHSSNSGWEDGWFVGGGIEALLTENLSLKAEYRFADYGSVKNDDSVNGNLQGFENFFANSHQDGDVTVHTVRAVLSWRFNFGL